MSTPENGTAWDDRDAWDLAMVAMQGLRCDTPAQAIDTAWELVELAKHKLKQKLESIKLEELVNSPDVQEQWQREIDAHLANCEPVSFEDGVRWITDQARKDRAHQSFKDFVTDKAKAREQTSDGIEARVEAMLIKYRNKGFTGVEAHKLKAGFKQWEGKGRQGRVRKTASDGRLRANRQKKLRAKVKAGLAELTEEKVEWRTLHYRQSVMKGARGKKGRTYRDSADNMKDTPPGQTLDATLDANPGLQAALNDPARA